ncbi:amidohydrolase family protein [Steroidobacter sp.]|uniref:amidohydrolase family protein n=1 Tax=Steroidobacter sp. TaxID=1978227 RepID=UPI001A59E552|nr:amidohydrolase family protein [Steroidobacter sp.]MBL8269312.1 amidohydrolase family protein [Steroidobacter sp.]
MAQTSMTPSLTEPAERSGVYALTNARVVVRPGQVLPSATLVVRDGLIAAVGGRVRVPADAQVVDVAGATVFAGFIDAQGIVADQPDSTSSQAPLVGSVSTLVRPQREVSDVAWPGAKRLQGLRDSGITSVLLRPGSGIFRGRAALLNTSGVSRWDQSLVASAVAQVASFETHPNTQVAAEDVYPQSIRGSIAVIRQSLLDAQWQRDVLAWHRRQGRQSLSPPVAQPALSALAEVLDAGQPMFFEAPDQLDFERIASLGQQFKLRWVALGNGYEYRYAQVLKADAGAVIVPLVWPQVPAVLDDEAALQVSLADMEHWQWAPYNARVLAESGVTFAFTSAGLSDPPEQFLRRVRETVARGLDEQTALAALTTVPARLLGMQDQLGTLEPGRRAQFLIADADLLRSAAARIHEVWVDGRRYVQSLPARANAASTEATSKPPLP